jgi:glycerophosphoryl diester phosphodiesterase
LIARPTIAAALSIFALASASCAPSTDRATLDDGAASATDIDGAAPAILVGHRGAAAYAPEHSIASYEVAIAQGVDYVEPDIQITSDGVLVALHDLTLERTTNVAEVFPDRFREAEVDGETVHVWPVNDFTLDEVRRLDAGSWFGDDFADARVPTLREVIEIARGRAGLFIETKAPEVYGDLGFDMEALLLEELERQGLSEPGADPSTPIIIQSFSAASLEILRHERGTRLPLALLISGGDTGAEWVTDEGLARAAKFATGIGPTKSLLANDSSIVARAHALGLTVVPWTFRARNPGDGFETVEEEMAHYLDDLGVDGIITDNPDLFPRSAAVGGS